MSDDNDMSPRGQPVDPAELRRRLDKVLQESKTVIEAYQTLLQVYVDQASLFHKVLNELLKDLRDNGSMDFQSFKRIIADTPDELARMNGVVKEVIGRVKGDDQ